MWNEAFHLPSSASANASTNPAPSSPCGSPTSRAIPIGSDATSHRSAATAPFIADRS